MYFIMEKKVDLGKINETHLKAILATDALF